MKINIRKEIPPSKILIKCDFNQKFHVFLPEQILKEQILEIRLNRSKSKQEDNTNYFTSFMAKQMLTTIQLSKTNHHFLQILAIDFEIVNQIIITSNCLTSATLLSLTQFLIILQNDKLEIKKRDKMETIQLFLKQGIVLLSICKEYLQCWKDQSYDLYIIEAKDTYQIVIGFIDFQLSVEKENLHEKRLKRLQKYLERQNQQDLTIKLEDNQFLNNIKSILKLKKQSNSDQRHQNFGIIHNLLSKYAQNVSKLIDKTIDGLTKMIYEKKVYENQYFNCQFISMIDKDTNKLYEGQIYHNLYCEHFEGISYQTYLTKTQCPYCGRKLIFDSNQIQLYCKNNFQKMLQQNYLNPDHKSVLYYFRQKTFTLKHKSQMLYRQCFSHFYHFKVYIQQSKDHMNRNQNLVYQKSEKITLYNKLQGKKKYFKYFELIDCPVRGRYCRHWEFYDLRRVYEEMLKSEKDYFECFVCCKDIKFEDIVYLKQVQLMVELCKIYYNNNEKLNINACLVINHQKKIINLQFNFEDKTDKFTLDLYQTFQNPLKKSRFDISFFQQKEISPPPQFMKYFYGY